jgi:sulfatase modifying factor 1
MMQRPCCAPSAASTEIGAPSRNQIRQGIPNPSPRASRRRTKAQVLVRGGSFQMGDHFCEGNAIDGETPMHRVELDDFWIDSTTVTNVEFAAFVEDTSYVTEAEQLGLSAVFHLAFRGKPADVVGRVSDAPWWFVVRGADWRRPDGPGSDICAREDHPVVHVTWNDAQAFAAWADKRLPTEAEWEYAARGGLNGARFPWGDELLPQGEWQCNIWQGDFPTLNTEEDGFLTTAPVESFLPNGYGLYQMAGNVWEWCADWFDSRYYSATSVEDPKGPRSGVARVIRGGSYLCHYSYCNRYRVAARSANTPDSATANMGFRCARSR